MGIRLIDIEVVEDSNLAKTMSFHRLLYLSFYGHGLGLPLLASYRGSVILLQPVATPVTRYGK
jgi:hypothetical protein